jgi:dipeptidyl aminopeptidase/acylaminoacyl peptidase
MRRFLALLGLPVLAILASAATKQPITGADVLKIRSVTSVAVASDGSFAVYGVQGIHTDSPADPKGEPAYKYRTLLWRIDLDNPDAKPEQLTFGDRSDSSPAISPDNRTLAFVRTDASGARAKPQVWLLPLRGPGEAQAVTKLENGAGAPVWRPDGKALLVTTPIPISKLEGKPHFDLESPGRDWFDWDRPAPGSKTGAEVRPDGDRRALRNWLARNASKDNPTVIDRINFLGEQDLQHEPEIAELVTIDLEHDNHPAHITKDFYNHVSAQYAPDGRSIVYLSTPPGQQHPDRVRRSAIWMIGADGSNPHTLLDRNEYSFNSPCFTPDGASLIVSGIQTDELTYRQAHLARFDIKDNKLTWLTEKWDSSARAGTVTADGTVLFTTPWHGGEPLLRVSAKGGEVGTLVEGPTGVGAFDEGGGRIVYALVSVPDPNELYVREKSGQVRQLTELNAWVKDKELAIPQERWITRPDGLKVQYWVMNPTHAEAGKHYPWVLDMHGGPSAMWGPGEFSMWWEFQLFCSWGYGVTYANPRGSGGYGYKFQKANFRNWGKGPMEDVLAALQDSQKTNPLADKDRLFLTGGSYAGYLTAWMIGHDHRFKAASAQRGVYDLSTFYGEANAWSLVPEEFGGYPWEPETRKVLDEESPITYVANIHTPFLIIHGSQDLRTGFAQSEMLFRSLKQLNRPVEYVRYPAIGHELTRSGPPLQRMDHMLRIIEFFERYAKNDRPAPVEQKDQPVKSIETSGAQQ